jgi:hypothetical protein
MSQHEDSFQLVFEVVNAVKKKKNSVVLVRKRTIPIERSPPVSEASANFSG